jgi:hypothetical protein
MHVSEHSRGESAKGLCGMDVSGQPLSLRRMGFFSSHWTVEGCFGY